jgi:hypothetical protein
MDNKLVKVEMTFDDGSSQVLEGEDAEKWLRDVNGCISNAYVHGIRMNEHPWKNTHDEKNNKKVFNPT